MAIGNYSRNVLYGSLRQAQNDNFAITFAVITLI